MKFKISILVLILLAWFNGFAQFPGPGSNWYFGYQAGLSWNTLQTNGDPMYLMDGQMITNDGVAAVSDLLGNLLFYTDGILVWDASHQVMSNSATTSAGGSLTGHFSSTQSAVIAPKPMDGNTFYIFTVDANLGTNGLAYSRVDMTANGGLGDIVLSEKNIPLFNPATEKITIVQHANFVNIWVITHKWNSNQFNVYLVNTSGVQASTPVISNVGLVHTGSADNAKGYLKASPDGSKVALGIYAMDKWELFDFNKTTGQLSNPVTLTHSSNDHSYGVEFSPDGHYLYGSEAAGSDIHQWDVSLTNPTAIITSHQVVGSCSVTFGGALQLAPDGKIYLARPNQKYLGRINSPNMSGLACNYVDQAILLGPSTALAKTSTKGLPYCINSSFFLQAEFGHETNCESDTVWFYIPNPQGLDMAYWNFDWPSTNPADHAQSSNDSIFFVYNAAGVYTVRLITERDQILDTVFNTVYFAQTPQVNLGADVTLCEDETLYFDLSFNDSLAVDGSCDYFWQAVLSTQTFYDSTATYLIDKPGTYTVTVSSDSICGSVTDQFQVSYNNLVASLGIDITSGLCVGNIHTLDATYSNTAYGTSEYTWNTGSTAASINVGSTGIYSVTIVNGSCTDIDSIYVEFDNPIVPPLGPDKFICNGSTVALNAANAGANYAWSDGTFNQTLMASQPGAYSVTITNDCGSLVDNIVLTALDIPDVDLGDDITICDGSPANLDAYVANSTYLWSTGSVLQQIPIFTGGNYSVTVTNECGSNTDEIFVFADTPLPNSYLGGDTIVCSGFVLDCGYPNLEYYWSNNETTQAITITQSDVYSLEATNACGSYTDDISIDIIELNLDLGGDTVLCPGSSLTLDAQNPGSEYNWSNLATSQTIQINQPGTVWVQVTNECETKSDTLQVTEYNINLDIGNDTTFCEGDVLILDAQHPGASYLWSTSQTSQTIEALQTGLYALTVSHYCGNLTDEINVTVNPSPIINFGADTLLIIGGQPIVLNPNATGTSYLWSDGTSGATATAPVPNTYSVTITNEYGCTGMGSVKVMYQIGIEESSIEDQITLYPNPVQHKLFISTGDLRTEEIRIYNSIGSLISQIKNAEGTIEVNTSNFSEGIYFVKIRTKDNELLIKPFSVVR
ncbi:MAG: T9SS type A sorting domain-containing protein [Bacteroidales bacterium]|nr:T9SS type A sorting domain-containing protein [Bacteroidales bacterium]MCF8455520.1 T9SS type A sorting domain-containing protein [Bacteroidales bacterium]